MEEYCLLVNVKQEVWAAWAQALLSAVAIVVSVRLVNHQHKLELRRNEQADTDRKRQHLESTLQLVGAVYGITQKLITWSQPGGTEPHDRYDLFKMRLELEGLVDALRQTNFGNFDQHTPIEAVLVALSVARQMVAHLKTGHGINAPLDKDEIKVIGEMGADIARPLKERLDKLQTMLTSVSV